MNCTNCNEKIEYQGKFCLNCGTALTPAITQEFNEVISQEPVFAPAPVCEPSTFTGETQILTKPLVQQEPHSQNPETDPLKPYLTNSIFDSVYFNDPNSRNINDFGYQNYLSIIKKINNSLNFSYLWLGFAGIIATRTMAYNGFAFDIGLLFLTIVNILAVSWPFILLFSFSFKNASNTANISTNYPLFFAGENEMSRCNILEISMEKVNGPENNTTNIICWILGILVFFANPEFAFLSRICFAWSASITISTIIQSVKAFKWWSILTFIPILSIIVGIA